MIKGRFNLVAIALLLVLLTLGVTACGQTKADVVAHNISQEAEQFRIARQIVFFNGITDKYLAVIRGYCSVETDSSALAGSLEVTCKLGEGRYKKSFFGLSDNVSYMVQQIDPVDVSTRHYTVIFRPETLLPDIDTN